jgi:hypothetical protein
MQTLILTAIFTLLVPAGFAAKGGTTCNRMELNQQGCDLSFKGANLNFKENIITLTRDKNKKIYEMPTGGADSNWEDIRLTSIAGRVFLQIQVWTAASSIDSEQLLYWTLFEITKAGLQLKTSHHVQSRTKLGESGQSNSFGPAAVFGIELRKKKLVWFVDDESQPL